MSSVRGAPPDGELAPTSRTRGCRARERRSDDERILECVEDALADFGEETTLTSLPLRRRAAGAEERGRRALFPCATFKRDPDAGSSSEERSTATFSLDCAIPQERQIKI